MKGRQTRGPRVTIQNRYKKPPKKKQVSLAEHERNGGTESLILSQLNCK